MASARRALVVGGTGFLGSAVCRSLVKHGYAVTSLARNGAPSFPGLSKTPDWAQHVKWIKGSATDETLLKNEILPNTDCVVHTLGVLFESDYKSRGAHSLASAIGGTLSKRMLGGPAAGLAGLALGSFLRDDTTNPLKTIATEQARQTRHNHPNLASSNAQSRSTYEQINRDSALCVLRAFLDTRPASAASSTGPPTASTPTSPFVYISAEDIFRPFVPDRYILTKREAEQGIMQLAETAETMLRQSEALAGENESEDLDRPQRLVRPILVRPGLMYDHSTRPITGIPSTLLKASAGLQDSLPGILRAQTLSNLLSSIVQTYSNTTSSQHGAPAAHASLANLLSTPPLHVDVVAEAIARALDDSSMSGVLDVKAMQSMVQGKGHHTSTSHVFA